jgi:hypothetical protein
MWFRNGKSPPIKFFALNTPQNYKFLENWAKIPCFIDNKKNELDIARVGKIIWQVLIP